MVEVDYEKIQVKDVADRAEIALGTFYRYFNSKDHLFTHAMLQWASGFRNHIDRRSSAPTADQVKAVYRRAIRAFEREPRVYGLMIQLQSSKDPYAAAVFHEYHVGTSEAFGLALAHIPSDRRDAVVSVMNAVLATNLTSWQLGRQPVTAAYAAIDRAVDLIFDPWPSD